VSDCNLKNTPYAHDLPQLNLPCQKKHLRAASGQYPAEIFLFLSSYPQTSSELAGSLPIRDHGPIPLCHGSSSHNNIVVGDEYQVVGEVEWEAMRGCWRFPLDSFSSLISHGCTTEYNEKGCSRVADLAQKVGWSEEVCRGCKTSGREAKLRR